MDMKIPLFALFVILIALPVVIAAETSVNINPSDTRITMPAIVAGKPIEMKIIAGGEGVHFTLTRFYFESKVEGQEIKTIDMCDYILGECTETEKTSERFAPGREVTIKYPIPSDWQPGTYILEIFEYSTWDSQKQTGESTWKHFEFEIEPDRDMDTIADDPDICPDTPYGQVSPRNFVEMKIKERLGCAPGEGPEIPSDDFVMTTADAPIIEGQMGERYSRSKCAFVRATNIVETRGYGDYKEPKSWAPCGSTCPAGWGWTGECEVSGQPLYGSSFFIGDYVNIDYSFVNTNQIIKGTFKGNVNTPAESMYKSFYPNK